MNIYIIPWPRQLFVMTSVKLEKTRFFKRSKIEPALYAQVTPTHHAFLNKVCDSSFAVKENRTDNLFIAEMSMNLVISMNAILLHATLENQTMTKHQLLCMNENRYSYWDLTGKSEIDSCEKIMDQFLKCTVIGFNTLHAVFSAVHTPRAKMQFIEKHLLQSIDKYNNTYIETLMKM